MKNSVAALLSKEKSANAKQIEDRHGQGVVSKLLLNHFRECMNPSGWYSMPEAIFSQQPMRPLVDALTHSLPPRNAQAQSSSLLPVADKTSMALSVCDRERLKELTQASQGNLTNLTPFLAIRDTDEVDNFIKRKRNVGNQPEPAFVESSDSEAVGSASAKPPAPQTRQEVVHSKPTSQSSMPTDMLSRDMVQFASNSSGLIVFRVSDKRPSLKKRPLAFTDALTTDDFTIRLYKVEEATATHVTVSALDHPTVPLAKLFSGSSDSFVDHLLQWSVAEKVSCHLNVQQHQVGEAALELIQDVLEAGAVSGSSKHFDTRGMALVDTDLVEDLIRTSYLKPTNNGTCVQLCSSALSLHLVLTGPRAVFETRVGSSHQLERVNLKHGSRPTQWELFLQLRRDGWLRSEWQGTMKELKGTIYEPGMDKRYYQDGFWYWLCLLNSNALHSAGFRLFHGQLESFYQAAIHLAREDPEKLSSLKPGLKAAAYKGKTSDNTSVSFLQITNGDGDDNDPADVDQAELFCQEARACRWTVALFLLFKMQSLNAQDSRFQDPHIVGTVDLLLGQEKEHPELHSLFGDAQDQDNKDTKSHLFAF